MIRQVNLQNQYLKQISKTFFVFENFKEDKKMKNITKHSYSVEQQFPEIPVIILKKILIPIFFIALVIGIYSCGGGIPSSDDQSVKHLPVEMNSYTVNFPAGSGWKSERNKSLNKVVFTRDKSSTTTDILGVLSGTGIDGYTYISIYENKLTADSTKSKWGEIETAEDFMNNEVKIMKEEGVKKEMYKLKNILKTDTVVNEKKFYCMDYEQYQIKMGGNSYFYSECKLALYFPANFKDSRKFYVFLISDFSNSIAIGRDTGQLFPLLASFKLKDEVL